MSFLAEEDLIRIVIRRSGNWTDFLWAIDAAYGCDFKTSHSQSPLAIGAENAQKVVLSKTGDSGLSGCDAFVFEIASQKLV